eukprot:5624056-Alexandrium_andersonii.AAC.1
MSSGKWPDPVWGALRVVGHSEIEGAPVAVFADQSKAFERVSWRWLRRVWRGWGLPEWLLRAVVALYAYRQ